MGRSTGWCNVVARLLADWHLSNNKSHVIGKDYFHNSDRIRLRLRSSKSAFLNVLAGFMDQDEAGIVGNIFDSST
jgi:hypothetical protein